MGRHICLLQPNKNEERKRTRRNTIKTCFENYSKTKRYLVSFRKRKRDCCSHVSKRFVFYQLTTIIHCFVVRDKLKFNNFRKKSQILTVEGKLCLNGIKQIQIHFLKLYIHAYNFKKLFSNY